MSGAVLVTAILAAVLLSRHDDLYPWLRTIDRDRGRWRGGTFAGSVGQLDRPIVLG